jgi:NADP-dependent 3-hydroxy acid dehydrogenase YdfG/Flp pilus assembly protein TadD
MSRKKLVLAYHPENQEAAQQIEKQLSPYGYSFKHLDSQDKSIEEQILETALPAILLVSDNFFKSSNCMTNAMIWTQKMMNLNLLLPVVVNGKKTNPETGKVESYTTVFQRVSDVIKYMHYWQDQYLLLRKKRRTVSAKKEPALSMQLQVVKNISSEIGEYLRFLKVNGPVSFTDFFNNEYAAFFQFTKDENYREKPVITEVTEETKKEVVVETPLPVVSTKKEFVTINERFAAMKLEEEAEDIPVFEPTIVPPKPEVVEAKISENIEYEIPNFEPAEVAEHFKNEQELEVKEVADDTAEIPNFEPEIVSNEVSNGAQKEVKSSTDDTDDIPVFVRAVVPDRSLKKGKEEVVVKKESQSLVDMIQASSKQILEENKIKMAVEVEEETAGIDLNTLPGMEMLANKEKTVPVNTDNPKDDFIRVIDAIGDIDESDMEFENEEEVGDLEDLASEIDMENNSVSMDELNQVVDEVVEEEAREANNLVENKEEELSELLSILEQNQVKDEAALNEVFNEVFNENRTAKIEKDISEETAEASDDIDDLFEENEVEETALENFTVNENSLKDEELIRLVAEVEEANEVAEMKRREEIADEVVAFSDEEEETEEERETVISEEGEDEYLDDIFEEDEEEEDDIYVQTDTLISRAYQHFEEEDWNSGLAILEAGVGQTPEDSDLRFQYALALAKHKNNFAGATRQLEILLGFDQQHEEAYFLLGELSEMHQDYLMARNYYEKVAAINDDFPEIYYRLGIITNLHFDDQKEEAVAYFKKAVKKNKLNADAHYRLGILMNEHFDKHLKAVKYFKKVLNIQPEHPFANYDLAILYHRLGDRALANIYYQKAVDINSELKTEDNDEAFKYELIGNVEEAIPLTNESNNAEMELARDMARIEAKMANIAKENAVEKQRIIGDLDSVFGGDADDDVMNDLYEEEIREAPVVEIPAMPKPVGKTILITGATSGIGRATAELFAENGYRIIITGRREERLDLLKTDFENRFGTDVRILPFDVRNVAEVKAAIDSLESEWQEIDILLNNAGLAKGTGPIHQGDIDHWEQMIDTNIKGLLYMTRAIAPHMVSNQEGHIINIASSAGKEVYPGGNVYCATKHAVDALTRAMRIDLHTHNVRVSQVAPGMVEETEFSLVRYDGDGKKAKIYEDFNPLTARDVAEVIYFVATRPKHVNVQDVLMFGTQQANSIYTNRDGRING